MALLKRLLLFALCAGCHKLPVAECSFTCEAGGRCALGLTCGPDGFCHADRNLDHCRSVTLGDGGSGCPGNLVANSGFEADDLSSWVSQNATFMRVMGGHSSSYALELCRSANVATYGVECANFSPAQAGASYVLSAWFHGDGQSQQNFALGTELDVVGGGGEVSRGEWVVRSDWQLASQTVQVPGDAGAVQIGCALKAFSLSLNIPACVTVDDICFAPAP
jgi:hypothetical protein